MPSVSGGVALTYDRVRNHDREQPRHRKNGEHGNVQVLRNAITNP